MVEEVVGKYADDARLITTAATNRTSAEGTCYLSREQITHWAWFFKIWVGRQVFIFKMIEVVININTIAPELSIEKAVYDLKASNRQTLNGTSETSS